MHNEIRSSIILAILLIAIHGCCSNGPGNSASEGRYIAGPQNPAFPSNYDPFVLITLHENRLADLCLTISSHSKVYKVGEDVVIDVEMQNIGSRKMDVITYSVAQDYEIEVWDQLGKPRMWTVEGAGSHFCEDYTSNSAITLKPGETRKLSLIANKARDMSVPGEYFISVKIHQDFSDHVISEANSNTIEVVVE